MSKIEIRKELLNGFPVITAYQDGKYIEGTLQTLWITGNEEIAIQKCEESARSIIAKRNLLLELPLIIKTFTID